jgi:hypothetical protein
MAHIQQAIPSPAEQRPFLVFFYKREKKTVALRALFPNNNITRHHGKEIANLRTDTTSLKSTRPLLFADNDPGARYNETLAVEGCHETRRFRINWHLDQTPAYSEIVTHLHVHLLFRFTDVLCVFAKDLGGLNATYATLLS